MDYTMTKPCSQCPFRRGERAVRLRKSRVREIAGLMTHSRGGEFACHMTVDYSTDDEETRDESREQHCAGGLIFAEKQGKAHQMMRIMERFGAYDPGKLDEASKAEVFDSVAEMLKTAAGR